ncbi:unnamed protein product [Linum tenue]|uniref:BHLH domain-containing protein n=1 Tax=Linum tenue TaxID=586396 RepID=A0AAV0MXB8_9ROSI|nr:unnamed protein product [Linum tenue]
MKRSNSSPSNSLESPTSTTTSNNDFIFHPSSHHRYHHPITTDHHHNNNLIDFQAGPGLLTFDHSSSWDNYDAVGPWDDDAMNRRGAFQNDAVANVAAANNNVDSSVTHHKHNKRPGAGDSAQPPQKKQSNGKSGGKAAKPSPSSSSSPPSKDPQSIAAKNRRERISERLKVLQELVPNGSKVDLVTMLEKAISYVKFLQLQVKVLATDEFWPAQGGKAPDIAQVKEAIDAILSSSRGRNNKNSSNSSNSSSEGEEEEEDDE